MANPGNSSLPLLYFYNGNPTNVSTAIINPPLGSIVIDYSTPALWQKTTVQGDNSGYNGASGGTINAPLITGGLTASGSAANTFAGSTGAFATSTGTNTFGGSTIVFSGGPLIETSQQTLTGAGAVDLTHAVTLVVTTGANALTLADGVNGQLKTIVMKTDGGDGTLTPTTKTGFTTITFNDIGDGVQLQFFTTIGWVCIANNGATLA